MKSLSYFPGLIKRFDSSNTVTLLAKAALGSTVIRVFGMVLTFFVGAQLARLLGVTGYGDYGFAISIIAILAVPTQFGFPQLLVREISSAKSQNDWGGVFGLLKWFGSASFRLSITMVLVAGICVWLMFKYGIITLSMTITLVVGLMTIPLVTLIIMKSAALRAVDYLVGSQIIEAIIQPGLMLIFVFFLTLKANTNKAEFAMAARWLSLFFSVAAAWFSLKCALPKRHYEINNIGISSKSLWYSAVPMAMTEGMRVLQGNMLTVILGLVANSYSVGVYKIANSTFLLIALPLTIINLVVAPIISKAFTRKDVAQLKVIMLFSALTMTAGVAILTLPLVFFGEEILVYAFGEGFGASNTPLLIMAGGAIISSMFGANVTFLNMCREERVVAKAFGISIVLTTLVAFPAIYFFGEVGAAISSSFVTISISLYFCLKVKSVLREMHV